MSDQWNSIACLCISWHVLTTRWQQTHRRSAQCEVPHKRLTQNPYLSVWNIRPGHSRSSSRWSLSPAPTAASCSTAPSTPCRAREERTHTQNKEMANVQAQCPCSNTVAALLYVHTAVFVCCCLSNLSFLTAPFPFPPKKLVLFVRPSL